MFIEKSGRIMNGKNTISNYEILEFNQRGTQINQKNTLRF